MEEKKKKKTIKCSYALLVIILFATVAFLTDYIIIDRKTRKCDCPQCEAINNEVISDNTDNTQVTEDKKDDDSNIPSYDPFSYAGLSCIEKTDTYCLVKNDTDLKVEVEIDSDHNYVLIINGNRFLPDSDYHVVTAGLNFFDDGYIYVGYDIQGLGPREDAFVLDKNANVVFSSLNFDDIKSNSERTARFENNKLVFKSSYLISGTYMACENKRFNAGPWPEYDEIVYVEYEFEYKGNGQFNEIRHVQKTFSERLYEQYGVSTCEESLNR